MPTILFDPMLKVDRFKLMSYLKEQNIDSRPFFYPLSSLPMFESIPHHAVAYDIVERAINLPSHHDITQEEVTYVADSILSYIKA